MGSLALILGVFSKYYLVLGHFILLLIMLFLIKQHKNPDNDIEVATYSQKQLRIAMWMCILVTLLLAITIISTHLWLKQSLLTTDGLWHVAAAKKIANGIWPPQAALLPTGISYSSGFHLILATFQKIIGLPLLIVFKLLSIYCILVPLSIFTAVHNVSRNKLLAFLGYFFAAIAGPLAFLATFGNSMNTTDLMRDAAVKSFGLLNISWATLIHTTFTPRLMASVSVMVFLAFFINYVRNEKNYLGIFITTFSLVFLCHMKEVFTFLIPSVIVLYVFYHKTTLKHILFAVVIPIVVVFIVDSFSFFSNINILNNFLVALNRWSPFTIGSLETKIFFVIVFVLLISLPFIKRLLQNIFQKHLNKALLYSGIILLVYYVSSLVYWFILNPSLANSDYEKYLYFTYHLPIPFFAVQTGVLMLVISLCFLFYYKAKDFQIYRPYIILLLAYVLFAYIPFEFITRKLSIIFFALLVLFPFCLLKLFGRNKNCLVSSPDFFNPPKNFHPYIVLFLVVSLALSSFFSLVLFKDHFEQYAPIKDTEWLAYDWIRHNIEPNATILSLSYQYHNQRLDVPRLAILTNRNIINFETHLTRHITDFVRNASLLYIEEDTLYLNYSNTYSKIDYFLSTLPGYLTYTRLTDPFLENVTEATPVFKNQLYEIYKVKVKND